MKHHDDHQKAEEGSEATDPTTRPQVVDDEQQQPSTSPGGSSGHQMVVSDTAISSTSLLPVVEPSSMRSRGSEDKELTVKESPSSPPGLSSLECKTQGRGTKEDKASRTAMAQPIRPGAFRTRRGLKKNSPPQRGSPFLATMRGLRKNAASTHRETPESRRDDAKVGAGDEAYDMERQMQPAADENLPTSHGNDTRFQPLATPMEHQEQQPQADPTAASQETIHHRSPNTELLVEATLVHPVSVHNDDGSNSNNAMAAAKIVQAERLYCGVSFRQIACLIVGCLVAIVLTVVLVGALSDGGEDGDSRLHAPTLPMLEQIRARGFLRCAEKPFLSISIEELAGENASDKEYNNVENAQLMMVSFYSGPYEECSASSASDSFLTAPTLLQKVVPSPIRCTFW
jgi:hypothetical protein